MRSRHRLVAYATLALVTAAGGRAIEVRTRASSDTGRPDRHTGRMLARPARRDDTRVTGTDDSRSNNAIAKHAIRAPIARPTQSVAQYTEGSASVDGLDSATPALLGRGEGTAAVADDLNYDAKATREGGGKEWRSVPARHAQSGGRAALTAGTSAGRSSKASRGRRLTALCHANNHRGMARHVSARRRGAPRKMGAATVLKRPITRRSRGKPTHNCKWT